MSDELTPPLSYFASFATSAFVRDVLQLFFAVMAGTVLGCVPGPSPVQIRSVCRLTPGAPAEAEVSPGLFYGCQIAGVRVFYEVRPQTGVMKECLGDA